MASPAEKLLVAGSDKDTRFLVRMSLRGYRVEILEVSTGPECIEKSLNTTPCLIIMNYIMDKTTGYELADRINKEIKLSTFPFLFGSLPSLAKSVVGQFFGLLKIQAN